MDLLEQKYTKSAPALDAAAIADELVGDLRVFYGAAFFDLRDASLADVWRIARDLVRAIDRWSEVWVDTLGSEKMAIAEEVAWRFLNTRGGVAAVRELVEHQLDGRLPGPLRPFTGWVVRHLLTTATLKRAVRFVLELAVREAHSTPATA